MPAGKYRQRIAIQRRTPTRGAAGGVSYYWDLVAERFGAELPIRGREYMSARQQHGELLTRFLIRYMAGLVLTMRVLTQDRAHDIKSIVDVEDRHKEIEILATADPQGAPEFQYKSIAVEAGPEANSVTITWETDAYTSSLVQYREDGAPDWTEPAETDTDVRVLQHSITITGLANATNYEANVSSKNVDDWTPTPQWQGSLTWGIGDSGEFLPGGYP